MSPSFMSGEEGVKITWKALLDIFWPKRTLDSTNVLKVVEAKAEEMPPKWSGPEVQGSWNGVLLMLPNRAT